MFSGNLNIQNNLQQQKQLKFLNIFNISRENYFHPHNNKKNR